MAVAHPSNAVLDLANCSYVWASICIFVNFSLIDDHSSVPVLCICISFAVVFLVSFALVFLDVFVRVFVLVFALVFSR